MVGTVKCVSRDAGRRRVPIRTRRLLGRLGAASVAGGDEPEGISRSYRKLFDKTTARREEENRRFGELLAASTSENSFAPGVLLIEDVLSKIVSPLAKRSYAGILLIVMDGMSLPVWRELSSDLSRPWVAGLGSGRGKGFSHCSVGSSLGHELFACEPAMWQAGQRRAECREAGLSGASRSAQQQAGPVPQR